MNRRMLFALVLASCSSASAQPELLTSPHVLQSMMSPAVPSGYVLIDGDILVPISSLLDSTFGTVQFWPAGIVPYEFDANVSSPNALAMKQAMIEIENVANVLFRARIPSDTAWLQIKSSTGNNSLVGMIPGGQPVNIFNWDYRFIMVHELCHALGYWHEQSRPDRDQFVQINPENICQTCCGGGSCTGNFNIRAGADTYGAYDFDSVMHYDAYAFSANGQPTITVLPPNQSQQGHIGQHDHLSVLDGLGLAANYPPPPTWIFVDGASTLPVQNGTSVSPYHQFPVGYSHASPESTLWVQSGTYSGIGSYASPAMIRSIGGTATIGN